MLNDDSHSENMDQSFFVKKRRISQMHLYINDSTPNKLRGKGSKIRRRKSILANDLTVVHKLVRKSTKIFKGEDDKIYRMNRCNTIEGKKLKTKICEKPIRKRNLSAVHRTKGSNWDVPHLLKKNSM